MFTPTISIDLGASYTKVAYRDRLERHGKEHFATGYAEAVVLERTATIPSVVIQTDDRDSWIMGVDAQGVTPNAGMTVFENWKSALYSSAFDVGKVNLVFVAGAFFKWLLHKLDGIGVDSGRDCRVRVTIPALKRIEDQRDVLIQCMRRSGWPEAIEVVQEPVANIVGVLSGGRNVVSGGGRINYQRTFGHEYGEGVTQLEYVYEEMRRRALGERENRFLNVAVVDFGSFTLDFARLKLDLGVVNYDSFPVASLKPESWEIGVIEDLDRPCFQELFSRHALDSERLSFGIKEAAKRAIYAGEPYAVPYKGGRTTVGHTGIDRHCVEQALASYCDNAWAKIKPRCKDAEVVVLTGGGASISSVRDYFREKLLALGVVKVIDFSEDELAVGERPAHDGLRDWRSVGEGLGRLATGLGGASIALGFVPDEACRKYVPRGSEL